MIDISFRKPEFVLGFKFPLSRSPAATNAPISYIADATSRRQSAPNAGGSGREGVGNAAERRRAGRRNLEAEPFRFSPLQPIEIPQNGQSFVWKSLDKNRLDLEKLAEKLWRPAFIPPPPTAPRRWSRTTARPSPAARMRRILRKKQVAGRGGKFSSAQGLEKSRNREKSRPSKSRSPRAWRAG